MSGSTAALLALPAWRGVHVSGGLLFAGEEARKKRAFFPEDVINSDYVFHLCLLSGLDHGLLSVVR